MIEDDLSADQSQRNCFEISQTIPPIPYIKPSMKKSQAQKIGNNRNKKAFTTLSVNVNEFWRAPFQYNLHSYLNRSRKKPPT